MGLKDFLENHPVKVLGSAILFGITLGTGCAGYVYVYPQSQEISKLEKELESTKVELKVAVQSNPAGLSQELNLCRERLSEWQESQKSWKSLSTDLNAKLVSCNNNVDLFGEIKKLSSQKYWADEWVDKLLTPGIMGNGSEPVRGNFLRAEEYKRQANQFQDQILQLQQKVVR